MAQPRAAHWPDAGPCTLFGLPPFVGEALLAEQDSGPATMFAATTAAGPPFPVNASGP